MMWRSVLWFLLLPYTTVVAQVNDGQLLENEARNRVMIVPFNPNYYLSDADQDIAAANQKKPHELSRIFRYGLDFSMQAQVQQQFETYSFLKDTASIAQSALEQLYSQVTYKYQKPFDLLGQSGVTNQVDSRTGDLFGISQSAEEKETVSKKKKGNRENEEADVPELPKEFMNAVVKDKSILQQVAGSYQVDYVIFLNQFELKTNYETCLDRSSNNFQREVLVHYSIYDALGNQLKGSALSVYFGSADNRLDQIIGEYLPQITAGIQRELLGQVLSGK